jgi:hypothetical protein
MRCDLDSVTLINIIKLIRKLYENINSNIFEVLHNTKDFQKINLAEFIMKLLSLCLRYKNINTTKEKFKSTDLIETNTEIGNIVQFIFEKLSDDCFIFKEREPYVNLLQWVIESLSNLVKNFKPMKHDELNDFKQYYIHLVLYILNNIILGKAEVKSDINFIFQNKLDDAFPELLEKLIQVLFELEKLTLHDKIYLPLFESIMDIFKKVNAIYGKIIFIDFGKLFGDQFKSLYHFIEKSGIYSENILYLLKALPLINIDGNKELRSIVKDIFISLLRNFSNYYNDDIYELFNLVLEKLGSNVDEEIINEIIKAVINKCNYKGSNFKNSSFKFFELLTNNLDYFTIMKGNIENSISRYISTYPNHTTVMKYKDIYIELSERLDFYKKFFEYIRDSKLDENTTIIECVKISLTFNYLALAKANDENIIVKVNEIITICFEVIYKLLTLNISKPENSIMLTELVYTFISHIFSVREYLVQVNRTFKNYHLVTENFKLLTRLASGVNNIFHLLKDNQDVCNIEGHRFINDIVSTDDDIIMIRIKLLQFIFNCIQLKEIPFKTTVNELMNFIECLIIELKDLTTDLHINKYFELLIPIATFYLDAVDEYQKIFGIEILLKFFQIKFENKFNKEIYNVSYNLPKPIWEKIYSLTNNFNYKISIFAVYLIQVLSPKVYIESLIGAKVSSQVKKFENTEIFKFKNANCNNYWMNEKEIEDLFNFIRDRIIFDIKVKNTNEKDIHTIPTIHHVEDKEFDHLIKVDEINDYIDDYEGVEDIAEFKEEKNTDNVSLEDLGVFEVEDEIFENFDEDNIPVIKNIYRRKKGSAEKLKTNQSARNLLMSNLNKQERPTEPRYIRDDGTNKRVVNIIKEKNKEDLLSDIQMRKSK